MRKNGMIAASRFGCLFAGLALLPAAASAQAPYIDGQETEIDRREAEKQSATLMARLFSWPPTVFRDTEYGDIPHGAAADAPGRGYPHYELPTPRYGMWYRPRAFGLGVQERCRPSPFRPRGYGNLFNRPSTCYRMDYHPYMLKEAASQFGPSYYRRQADPRCPKCGPLFHHDEP